MVKADDCSRCGAPIYTPAVWMSVSPPPNYYSCDCWEERDVTSSSNTYETPGVRPKRSALVIVGCCPNCSAPYYAPMAAASVEDLSFHYFCKCFQMNFLSKPGLAAVNDTGWIDELASITEIRKKGGDAPEEGPKGA